MKWLIGIILLTLTACSAHTTTPLEVQGHLATMKAKEACYKSQDVGNDPLALAIKGLSHAAHGDPCASSDLFTAQETEVVAKNNLAGKAIDSGTSIITTGVQWGAGAYTVAKVAEAFSDKDDMEDLRDENEELEEELEEGEEEVEEEESEEDSDCYWGIDPEGPEDQESRWICPDGM